MTGPRMRWTPRRLRYCLQIDPAAPAALRSEPDLPVTFLPMEAVGEDGSLDLTREISVGKALSGYTFLADGDVLLAKVTPCFENGKGAIAAGLTNGYGFATTEVYSLRPSAGINPRFLDYLLRSTVFRQYGSARLTGAGGLKRVSATDIRNFSSPVPPLDEQRAIADFLDRETARIDTLIEEQQRLIELLHERRSSALAQCTTSGDPIPLGRVLTHIRQGSSPTCEPWPADGIDEWAVLKVGCSNTGRFQALENKRLPDTTAPQPENAVLNGEIVMSRSNTKELVGCASVVDRPYPRLLLSDLTYGLGVGDLADNRYVAYSLASSHCRHAIASMAKGSSPSMQKISQRDVREIPLYLPSIVDQRRIVTYLDDRISKIDTLIAETEKFIDLSRERRSALITAAVTGQIDVREKVAE